jgi:hypothetical protein
MGKEESQECFDIDEYKGLGRVSGSGKKRLE